MIRPLVLLVALAFALGALFMATRPDESSKPAGGTARVPSAPNAIDSPEASPPTAEPRLPRSRCEAGSSNCVVASGTVIYVEAVDPDGDGDAHFVTTSEQGVTLPGITVFDVAKDLRPDPLPEVGDLVGGAGPVYRGSRGQKQIQVTEFHAAR